MIGEGRLPRERGQAGPLASFFAWVNCFLLLCLTFQINVSEDDIEDGFKKLFAQLAGEVGVPRSLCSSLWLKRQSFPSGSLQFQRGEETNNKTKKLQINSDF